MGRGKASLHCEFLCASKACFSNKTFSTFLACERTLSCVNSHVDFKASFLSETYSTLLAGERVLSL